jgi:hypothetical protein
MIVPVKGIMDIGDVLDAVLSMNTNDSFMERMVIVGVVGKFYVLDTSNNLGSFEKDETLVISRFINCLDEDMISLTGHHCRISICTKEFHKYSKYMRLK